MKRGPHPRASYPSASITVRLEGFAPPTHRLSSEHSAVELQTGNCRTFSAWIRTTRLAPFPDNHHAFGSTSERGSCTTDQRTVSGPRTTENPRTTARRAGEGSNEESFHARVYATGIAPASSRSRTSRSPLEPHVEKRSASIWSRTDHPPSAARCRAIVTKELSSQVSCRCMNCLADRVGVEPTTIELSENHRRRPSRTSGWRRIISVLYR